MPRTLPARGAVTWKRAFSWLAGIAVLLVGADLAERFLLYGKARKDRGSLVGLVRRPVKDTALALVHSVPPAIAPATDAEGEPVPVFDLYLKPEDEAFLQNRVTRVQLLSTHDEVTKEEVSARLAVEGHQYDVRVKLRGRQYYHVIPPRPSLRVDLRHGRAYRGSTLFNLIDPFDKTGDQAFLWESQEHDLIGWDTTMGILAMNGNPVGVVQYVEQPRIETGDRNGRPEGMFFRGSGEHYSEGADPERCGKVVKRVVRWLGDTQGTITWEELEELFDVERLRWFTALTEFSGDGHGFADFNMKGFCDPVSLKAEMLIWDTRFGEWSALPTSQFAEMGTQLLRCDRFRLLHDRALYVLANERLEPMLARAEAFFARYGELLASDPLYLFPRGGPDGGFMRDRPEKLRNTLMKNAADIRAALTGTHLTWYLDPSERTLELATDDRGPKEIVALEIQTGDRMEVVPLPAPVEIPGRYRDHRPVRVVPLPPELEPTAVRGVLARNLCDGSDVRGVPSTTPLGGARGAWDSAPALASLPELPDGFAADPGTRTLRVGPGTVSIAAPLSLPRGWDVRVEPGTELVLAPEVFVEVRGALAMPGRSDAPILVRRAGAEPWGAFAVLGERTAPVKVELAYASFLGGAGSNAGAVRCTGSVAFYFTDVAMDHVTVGENTSEDALNAKFSAVRTRDCLYRDGASDGVDYDFCTGIDLRSRVERFGEDGIELSGSSLRVEGAVLREVGARGLSVGDGSRAEYVNVTLIGPQTGVAIKDKSDARFERLTIVRADTAVALYVKKPSFGPSRAFFGGLRVLDTAAMLVRDEGCEVRFEGALRFGSEAAAMRSIEGVENRVVPGLEQLAPDELLARFL